MNMKKLIIDRKKWRRGFDSDRTRLLNEVGMCCLGFDAINEGFTKSDIVNLHYPNDLHKRINGIAYKQKVWRNTKVSKELATVNDDSQLSERKREAKITKLFAKIGRKVKFIN